MNIPQVAFKEWAVICRALALGRQSLILRKGGVAEQGDGFRVDHESFWLLPTFVHQQEEGVIEAYRPLLKAARQDRPPEGTLRLTHFCEVCAVRHLDTLDEALSLADLHGWSEATVRARFEYRRPGLFALAVRVWSTDGVEIADRPEYAGCKSWVPLADAVAVQRAELVVDEVAMAKVNTRLRA